MAPSRTTWWLSLSVALWLGVSGCECGGLDLEGRRFACSSDADCADGYHCAELEDGLACLLGAASDADASVTDSGQLDGGDEDGGAPDSGADAGRQDGGPDASVPDASVPDASVPDASVPDASVPDASVPDASVPDASVPDASVPDASVPDASVRDASVPDAAMPDASVLVDARLVFDGPASASVGLCSEPFTVQARRSDGGSLGNLSGSSVAVGGVDFDAFEDSSCTRLSRTPGFVGDTATFYARPSVEGTTRVSVTAFSKDASIDVRVYATPRSVLLSTPDSTPLGGTCARLTVTLRSDAGDVRAGAPVPVTLSAELDASVGYFSNAGCTTAVSEVTIRAGLDNVSAYFKPLSAGRTVLTGEPLDSRLQGDTHTVDVLPIVRTATCAMPGEQVLPDGGHVTTNSTQCVFAPGLAQSSRAMLVQQVRGAADAGQSASLNVSCRFTDAGTDSSFGVATCTRQEGKVPVNIALQVAEIVGARVQGLSDVSCTAARSLPTPVDADSSFVLRSLAASTSVMTPSDLATVELNPNGVSVIAGAGSTGCRGFEVQVVEWPGLSVVRGAVALDAGQTSGPSVSVPVATAPIVLLQTQPAAMRPACASLVRGRSTSTAIALSRAGAVGGCALPLERLAYERIDFGSKASVQQLTVSLSTGALERSVVLSPPVDPSRTLVLSSSQASGGQGAGETDDTRVGTVSAALVSFELLDGGSVLRVSRGDARASATIEAQVVELSP